MAACLSDNLGKFLYARSFPWKERFDLSKYVVVFVEAALEMLANFVEIKTFFDKIDMVTWCPALGSAVLESS